MHHPLFRASVTCVRVPVYRSHSVAVSAEFDKPVTVEAARDVLKKAPGLDLMDEPENQKYPMPLFTSEKYNCEVGRIRLDCALDNGRDLAAIIRATQAAIAAAVNTPGLLRISAGNYGGRLGKSFIYLRPDRQPTESAR
jgi:aspartate-semialdehyde dehydrogenase